MNKLQVLPFFLFKGQPDPDTRNPRTSGSPSRPPPADIRGGGGADGKEGSQRRHAVFNR